VLLSLPRLSGRGGNQAGIGPDALRINAGQGPVAPTVGAYLVKERHRRRSVTVTARLCGSNTHRQHVTGADCVELSVRDDGPGFPDSILANAFEPY